MMKMKKIPSWFLLIPFLFLISVNSHYVNKIVVKRDLIEQQNLFLINENKELNDNCNLLSIQNKNLKNKLKSFEDSIDLIKDTIIVIDYKIKKVFKDKIVIDTVFIKNDDLVDQQNNLISSYKEKNNELNDSIKDLCSNILKCESELEDAKNDCSKNPIKSFQVYPSKRRLKQSIFTLEEKVDLKCGIKNNPVILNLSCFGNFANSCKMDFSQFDNCIRIEPVKDESFNSLILHFDPLFCCDRFPDSNLDLNFTIKLESCFETYSKKTIYVKLKINIK